MLSGSPASARATKRATTVGGRAPRPVRDAEAQDRRREAEHAPVRAAVHLAGELRRRVEVRRARPSSTSSSSALARRARCRRPRSCCRRRSGGSPRARAASSTTAVPRVLTRSARSGSGATSSTSATAARWMTRVAAAHRLAQRTTPSRMSPIDACRLRPAACRASARGRRRGARARAPAGGRRRASR